MALSARNLLARLPSVVANRAFSANASKFWSINHLIILYRKPLLKNPVLGMSVSTTDPAAKVPNEPLTLTDACVQRLKQICDDDNSYLRVLVTFLFTQYHSIQPRHGEDW